MSQLRGVFNWGFVLGFLICVGLNIYSLFANYGGCIDCYRDFGFPFHFGDQLLFIALEIRHWPAFVADVGFALLCGTVTGFFFRFIRLELESRD